MIQFAKTGPDGEQTIQYADSAGRTSEMTRSATWPDECEEESLMGGGSSMMIGGDAGEGSTAEGGCAPEAWEAFYERSAGQYWGPSCETPMDAQFAVLVAKLR